MLARSGPTLARSLLQRPAGARVVSGRCAADSPENVKVLLIVLCFFVPWLAVLIKKGPTMEVVWAFLLQLLGHIPGVIYGLVKVTED
ncbi:MAG: hypothetical protein JWM85_3127 [Acidimicrobiaceae bacterium]|nr:hypothetical protein [Acidimicrobiaceae bacterium]